MNDELIRWYALDAGGDIVLVGDFATFEEADASRPAFSSTVWMVDEAGAREWQTQLNALLN